MVQGQKGFMPLIENMTTEKPIRRTKKLDGTSSSICFDCDNAVCGCEWSQKFKPVPGWKAELVYFGRSVTYHVDECPKYVETPDREGTAGMLSDEDEAEFFRDPITFIECHSKGDKLMADRHRRGRPKKEEKSA